MMIDSDRSAWWLKRMRVLFSFLCDIDRGRRAWRQRSSLHLHRHLINKNTTRDAIDGLELLEMRLIAFADDPPAPYD